MLLRLLLSGCLLFLLPAAVEQESGTVKSRGVPETCPASKPSDEPFVPPSPYPTKASAGSFWFGTDRLWTILRSDARWPQDVKTFWWRQEWGRYDWGAHGSIPRDNSSKLRVSARRLDAPAPSPVISRAKGGYREQDLKAFLVGGIKFSTPGCWSVTGRYDDDELTFVVWVAK